METTKTHTQTFKTSNGKFQKGYYFLEIWSGPAFWKFYAKRTKANAARVNNSPYVLRYFEALPDGAMVKHSR